MVIGLTGGIATGKSTVLEMFRTLGAFVLSADEVARELLQPGTQVYLSFVESFGKEYLRSDGQVDRAALARRIYLDPNARRRLDSLTHPAILKRLRERIEALRASGEKRPIVVEIPLLYEVNAQDMVDRVVVVASEHATQFARLKRRTGWPDDQVEAAILSQMPLFQKIALADWVVWSNGSLEETAQQVREIWKEITEAAEEDRQ